MTRERISDPAEHLAFESSFAATSLEGYRTRVRADHGIGDLPASGSLWADRRMGIMSTRTMEWRDTRVGGTRRIRSP